MHYYCLIYYINILNYIIQDESEVDPLILGGPISPYPKIIRFADI